MEQQLKKVINQIKKSQTYVCITQPNQLFNHTFFDSLNYFLVVTVNPNVLVKLTFLSAVASCEEVKSALINFSHVVVSEKKA